MTQPGQPSPDQHGKDRPAPGQAGSESAPVNPAPSFSPPPGRHGTPPPPPEEPAPPHTDDIVIPPGVQPGQTFIGPDGQMYYVPRENETAPPPELLQQPPAYVPPTGYPPAAPQAGAMPPPPPASPHQAASDTRPPAPSGAAQPPERPVPPAEPAEQAQAPQESGSTPAQGPALETAPPPRASSPETAQDRSEQSEDVQRSAPDHDAADSKADDASPTTTPGMPRVEPPRSNTPHPDRYAPPAYAGVSMPESAAPEFIPTLEEPQQQPSFLTALTDTGFEHARTRVLAKGAYFLLIVFAVLTFGQNVYEGFRGTQFVQGSIVRGITVTVMSAVALGVVLALGRILIELCINVFDLVRQRSRPPE